MLIASRCSHFGVKLANREWCACGSSPEEIVAAIIPSYRKPTMPRKPMDSSSMSRHGAGLVLVVMLSLLVLVSCSSGLRHVHPLDPLTADEHLLVRSILVNASLLCSMEDCHVVASQELEEPDKAIVKAWLPGKELPPRKARTVIRQEKITRVIIVNLETLEIESNEVYAGVGGSALTPYESRMVGVILKEYEPFVESLVKRGLSITETSFIPLTPGWYNVPEDEGKRLIDVEVFYMNGTENFYMRPIAGISAIIDLDEKRVYKYRDNYKAIPVPKREGTDYRFQAQQPPLRSPLNIISIEQPNGPSFSVKGHTVEWGNYWRFHLKMDSRAGTVISMAEVNDGEGSGSWRSVLYEGFVSEMFVPYQDPTQAWYFKTYMDAGEYGLGAVSSPLQPLNDCPRHAQFLDVVLPTSTGMPMLKSNAICIFERYAGDVAWRHTETFASDEKIVTEARPKVTLVVRMVTTVGNYDYQLDWEFQTDGIIRAAAGLTGMVMPRATATTYMKDGHGVNGEELYGTLISENTVGVTHDHFLTYRLDVDVDGPKNSFLESKMKRHYIQTGAGIPRTSYWDTEKHVAQTEADARIQLSMTQPSEYFVINSEKKTRLGNPIGYKLVPSATAATLIDPDDFPQKRAAFVNNQIWATQYHKEEKWASGQFTYQSHGDDTLSVWSSRNRNIANEDIVLWYTLGFHHIPVQEDFPIMPTVTGSFELKPANFFERNPVLKTRPNTTKKFAAYFAETDQKIEI